jgi:hypothetical protein
MTDWVLVLAAGLVATPLAVARPSHIRPVQWAEEASPETAPSMPSMPSMSAEARKGEEVRVKMAWLGNPSTFPYHLDAHAEEGTIKLTGYLPCETLKQRANELAGKATTLQVIDEIKVHEGMAFLFPARKPHDVLSRDAADVLHQGFGDRASRLTLTARADGQLILSGPMTPLEEQLAIAESLRQVAGCSCVVSKLEVPETGVVLNPEERLPPPKRSFPFGASRTTSVPAKPEPLTRFPSKRPVPKAVPLLAPEPAGPPLLTPFAEPIRKPVGSPYSTPPQTGTRSNPPAAWPMPAPLVTAKEQRVEYDPFADEPQPVSARPPAPKWEPVPRPVPPTVTGGGYVSAGVVSFEEESSVPPARGSMRLSPAEQIQRTITAAGGASVRRVQVRPLAGGKFDLDLTLCNADGWEQMLQRLETLPTLKTLQINWNVTLAP